MKKITSVKPTIRDVIPDLIESSPKSGPTVLSSTTTRGVGKALILIIKLSLWLPEK